MNLNGINTASRLREICKAITEHADQFAMRTWFSELLDDNSDPGGCGTAACIGGWAHHLFKANGGTLVESDQAPNFNPTVTLGLDHGEAKRLFYQVNWPSRFYWGLKLQTPADRAAIAVERISHFIATEGKE